jgi:hypothetical protein
MSASRLGSARAKGRYQIGLCYLVLLALIFAAVGKPAEARWLARLGRMVEYIGGKAATPAASSLNHVAHHIKTPAGDGDRARLAAEATPEGHWRFVNAAEEVFTAASAQELRRALAVLAPEASGKGLALYLTEETVCTYRAHLQDLPKLAELYVLIDSEAYPLIISDDVDGAGLYALVAANFIVELGDSALFKEAVWQLARPLNQANLRVLALEPGGPQRLSSSPRIDPVSKRQLIDVVDPMHLAEVFASIRGQTVLITGRIEGERLYVSPSSGPEISVLVSDLMTAGERADISVIVLQSPTPRQPGGRNWLWQTVEVRGLEDALATANMSDFLKALAGPGHRLTLTLRPQGSLRTLLDLSPGKNVPEGGGSWRIDDAFPALIFNLAGKVVIDGVKISAPNREYQRELDARLISEVPAVWQDTYLLLLIVGVLGAPLSQRWWGRIWPREVREDYAGAFGYRTACAVRWLAFAIIFMPATGVASAPLQGGRKLCEIFMMPMRTWHWWQAWRATPHTGKT